jgi:protein-arginine kinase activator protein McsA
MHPNTARKLAQRHVSVAGKVCESCGKPHRRLNRHHEDYSKPLEVQILCPSCHAIADARLGNRPIKPTKTCVVCGATFAEYTHSRVKTCGAECLAAIGTQNARKRWGEEVDMNRVGQLLAAGKSLRAIGRALGVSHQTVSRAITAANSPDSPTGPADDPAEFTPTPPDPCGELVPGDAC